MVGVLSSKVVARGRETGDTRATWNWIICLDASLVGYKLQTRREFAGIENPTMAQRYDKGSELEVRLSPGSVSPPNTRPITHRR